MLLIIGLGNPGAQHAYNRHNVGFMAADLIHRRQDFSAWRRRFQAQIAEATIAGEKCLLIKPQTYMNESGRAVQEAVRFYKLAAKNVLVIHDEVDLAPGKIRMKADGGVAGHNGLRSIGATIGNGFRRLRIGIGHPGDKDLVARYVLHDFAKADAKWLEPLIEAIADHLPLVVGGKDQTFANRLHEALAAPPAEARPTADARPTPADDREAPSPTPAAREGPLARGLKALLERARRR